MTQSVTSGDDQNSTKKLDSFAFRSVPDSVIKNLQNRKEFAYANDPEYWQREEEEDNNNKYRIFRHFLKYLVWAIVIAVLVLCHDQALNGNKFSL